MMIPAGEVMRLETLLNLGTPGRYHGLRPDILPDLQILGGQEVTKMIALWQPFSRRRVQKGAVEQEEQFYPMGLNLRDAKQRSMKCEVTLHYRKILMKMMMIGADVAFL